MKMKWPLLVSAILVGCATLHPTIGDLGKSRTVSLSLIPRVVEGRYVQSVVNLLTVASIASVSIIPEIEASGSFVPMDQNGQPTTLDDPNFLQIVPQVFNPNAKITIDNLKLNTNYKFLIRAYDANNRQISQDASSSIEVAIANEDRPTFAPIPIQLASVPFSARTSVTLSKEGTWAYDHVTTSLSSVVAGLEFPVPGTIHNNASASIPATLNLNGLAPNTTYRMHLSVYEADGTIFASKSVDIPVGIDDTPATVSLPFALPTVIDAPGVKTLAVDGNGVLYYSDGSKIESYLNEATSSCSISGNIANAATRTFAGMNRGSNGNVYFGVNLDFTSTLSTAFYGYSGIDKAASGSVIDLGNAILDGVFTADRVAACSEKDGHVYFLDTDTGKIWNFDGSANSQYTTTDIPGAKFITWGDNGEMYLVKSDNTVKRAVKTWSVVGHNPLNLMALWDWTLSLTTVGSGFSNPGGMAADSQGNIYVADTGNNTIKKISSQGNVTTVFSRVNAPQAVALGSDGRVYIADTGNNRILILPR